MNTKNIVINLGCAAPFIGTYFIIPRFTLPFDFYDHYFIFFIIHIYHLANYKNLKILPNWFIGGLSLLFLGSLFASFYSDSINFNLLKQLLGIIFSASSYYIIFKLANFNIRYLFDRYFYFAVLAGLFAIVEEVLHLAGVHILSSFEGSFGLFRVGGLSGEPYNLAMVLIPAIFFNLLSYLSKHNNTKTKYIFSISQSVIILIAFFLTLSSTGYIGLFLSILLIAIHTGFFSFKSSRILLFPVLITGAYFLFSFLSTSDKNFERKVDEGLWFFQTEENISIKDYTRFNSSSFALISNYQIAFAGFKENPIFGIGLGNYEKLYHQKFDKLFGSDFEQRYGQSNFNDANSMFLRLLAETGLWGLSIFLLFLAYFFTKEFSISSNIDFYLLGINHAISIFFIVRLLRCGNYISDGAFFFLFLFYYSYKLYNSTLPKFKQAV